MLRQPVKAEVDMNTDNDCTDTSRGRTRTIRALLSLIALLLAIRPCFVLGSLVALLLCWIHGPLVRWYPIMNWAFFLCAMGVFARFVWRCYLNGIRSVWRRILVWTILLVCFAINWFRVSIALHKSFVTLDADEDDGFEADIALDEDEDEDEARVPGVPLTFSIGGPIAEKPRPGERFVRIHLGFDSQRGKTWCQDPATDVFSEKGANLLGSLKDADILYSAQKNVLASSVLAAAAFPNMTGRRYVLLDDKGGKSEAVRVLSIQSPQWPSQWKGVDVSQAMLSALEEEVCCNVILFAESLEAFADYPIRVFEEAPTSVRGAGVLPNRDVRSNRNGVSRVLGNLARSPGKVVEAFYRLSLNCIGFIGDGDVTWGELSAFLSCFPENPKIRLYVMTSDRGILDGEAIAMATLDTWSREFLESLDIHEMER